ncbi:MAG TPA: hypothetical protein EYP98_16350 [Planctomycetes bacterium]|nr:hypothetical protein [Planctomycetota bacterium]
MSDGQLHAIVGDDDFLVRQKAKEVFDSLLEHYPDDLSREIVDGRADRVDDVMDRHEGQDGTGLPRNDGQRPRLPKRWPAPPDHQRRLLVPQP